MSSTNKEMSKTIFNETEALHKAKALLEFNKCLISNPSNPHILMARDALCKKMDMREMQIYENLLAVSKSELGSSEPKIGAEESDIDENDYDSDSEANEKRIQEEQDKKMQEDLDNKKNKVHGLKAELASLNSKLKQKKQERQSLEKSLATTIEIRNSLQRANSKLQEQIAQFDTQINNRPSAPAAAPPPAAPAPAPAPDMAQLSQLLTQKSKILEIIKMYGIKP